MIRVLVAEDSPTARALLVAMMSADPEIRIIAEAKTGTEAVEMALRLRPDLVTMDVQMPEIDGLEATKRIMAEAPCPILIVSSQARDADISLSLDATRAGALLVLPKPEGPSSLRFEGEKRHLVSMVKALATVKVVRRRRTSTGFADGGVCSGREGRTAFSVRSNSCSQESQSCRYRFIDRGTRGSARHRGGNSRQLSRSDSGRPAYRPWVC